MEVKEVFSGYVERGGGVAVPDLNAMTSDIRVVELGRGGTPGDDDDMELSGRGFSTGGIEGGMTIPAKSDEVGIAVVSFLGMTNSFLGTAGVGCCFGSTSFCLTSRDRSPAFLTRSSNLLVISLMEKKTTKEVLIKDDAV